MRHDEFVFTKSFDEFSCLTIEHGNGVPLYFLFRKWLYPSAV